MSVDGSKVREALDLLRRDGWCKWSLRQPDGTACCINGALNIVATGQPLWNGTINAAAERAAVAAVAAEQYPERIERWLPNADLSVTDSVSFNNHPDTTFEDVERVMEKAALRLDEAVQC